MQPTNAHSKSLILTAAQCEAAVGTSDVMEVHASHLTFLTDLCVEFVDPSRVGTRSGQNGCGSVPRLSRRIDLHSAAAEPEEAERRGGNKSHASTCLCGCTSVYVCARLLSGRVATLINSLISFHPELLPLLLGLWQVTLVSCSASGK